MKGLVQSQRKKHDDIKQLLQYVPPVHHAFYQSIVVNDTTTDTDILDFEVCEDKWTLYDDISVKLVLTDDFATLRDITLSLHVNLIIFHA